MDTEERKIQFFKNKIKARIEELRDFMPEIKYKLYKTMIEDCDSYDEIREMAELDLQFNMIHYVKDLKDKLKDNNTNIEELEAVTNKNVRASKLVVITPKPKNKLTNTEKLADIDLSTLGEDMEDEDVLASAANLLLLRMRTMPPEELYREEIENYEDDNIEDIDNLDADGLFEETDEALENDDDDDELEFEDGAIEDLEEELTEKKLDIRDTREEDDEEDEDDILDFGDVEQGVDIDDLDSLEDSLFTEEIDGIEDDEDYDIDSMDDSELFDDNGTSDFEDESDDFDIDSMDDSDIFMESEEDDFENEDDDSGIDSIDDSDIFENDSEVDDDSIDDSDMFGDDDFEDDSDGETNIDDIDDSELFDDSDSEDNLDESDEDDIDNIEDDFNQFDIEEDDFSEDEPEDDLDDFFNDLNNNTDKSQNQNNIKKRQIAPNKIFLNNTKRGEQTQKMFNLLNGLIDNTAKLAIRASGGAKRAASNGIQRVNNSRYFNLDSNSTRR